jgi:hypothetical protein
MVKGGIRETRGFFPTIFILSDLRNNESDSLNKKKTPETPFVSGDPSLIIKNDENAVSN